MPHFFFYFHHSTRHDTKSMPQLPRRPALFLISSIATSIAYQPALAFASNQPQHASSLSSSTCESETTAAAASSSNDHNIKTTMPNLRAVRQIMQKPRKCKKLWICIWHFAIMSEDMLSAPSPLLISCAPFVFHSPNQNNTYT